MASNRRGAARGRLSVVGATPAPVAADLVDPWLTALAADDRSPATIRAYRAAARGFLAWYAGEEGRPALLADLTAIAIQGWRLALQHGDRATAPRATATVNARLAGLRAWCAWLRGRGHLADDPAARVKLVGRGAPPAPQGLAAREAAALLRAAGRGRHGVRDVAIVHLLLQTGLRIGECAALDLEDLVVGERGGRLTVRAGKGNKAREVPLNGSARAALAEYVAPHLGVAPTLAAVARAWPRRRPGAAGTPLWRSQKGGRLGVSAMRRAIDGVVADCAGRGLVPATASAHTLRHTFAAHYLQTNPGDLLGLAALLGHASLDTTRLYAGPTAEQLAARVDRLALNAYAN